MASTSLPTRLVSTLAITTTAAVSGANFALSAYLIPRILESPEDLLLKQWRAVYWSVRATLPAPGAIAGFAFFYLAYDAYYLPLSAVGFEWKAYAVAGVMTIAVAPYHALFMGKNEEQLLEGDGKGKVNALVGEWGWLNLGKGGLLGVAAILGAWAAL